MLALGASELLDLRRWEEGLEPACGLWLIASPFIFGYAGGGTLRLLALRPGRREGTRVTREMH